MVNQSSDEIGHMVNREIKLHNLNPTTNYLTFS